MKLSPRWIASLRWFALITASLGTLVALAVVIENWRGDRAWAEVERQLVARGEPIDPAAFAQPPVPDERNFFKEPELERILFLQRDDPVRAESRARMKLQSLGWVANQLRDNLDPVAARPHLRRFELIPADSAAPAQADLLTALAPAAPLLDAVRRAGTERPAAWLPIASPPLSRPIDGSTMMTLGNLLVFRAKILLSLGRVEEAFADLWGALRLAQALGTVTPSMLQTMISTETARQAAEAMKQGSARHQWSDAHLRAFDRALRTIQPLANLRRAIQAERTWSIYYLSTPTLPETDTFIPRWIPRGWVQQNKVVLMGHLAAALDTFDPIADRVFPDRVAQIDATLATLKHSHSPHVYFVKMIAMNFTPIVSRLGQASNGHACAIVANTLERHYLAHGRYPEALAALVPELLPAIPLDVFSGEPLRYARTSEGFTLTSLDEKGRDVVASFGRAR